jgi:hypothetical protein
MTDYRVRPTGEGWVVESFDRAEVAVEIANVRISAPKWEVAAGPFDTEEEAVDEMNRLKDGN